LKIYCFYNKKVVAILFKKMVIDFTQQEISKFLKDKISG